jgi:hypothetical protein
MQVSQFQNVLFCPISASPLSGIYASLRQAQILILEILNVFLRLKFSPSLILNPAVSGKHFETASMVYTSFFVTVHGFKGSRLPFYCLFNNPANRMEEILGNMHRLKGFIWKHVFNISKPVSGCDHDSLQVRSLR